MDDLRIEDIMIVILRWMHNRKEVDLGPQRYKLYEGLGDQLLMNTQE